LNYADSLAKATAYLKSQTEYTALHSGKTALQVKRLQLQCERLTIENDKARGQIHDKHDCATSITEAVSRLNTELMALGSRLAAQFPEIPKLKDAADATVDELLERVRKALNQ
jgi:hypothetical protein